MKRSARIILLAIVVIACIAGVVGWQMYNKPHKKAEDVAGIQVSVSQLANEYTKDEQAANAEYLNKAIEVTGKVTSASENQDGILVVMLGGDDPTAVVQCTMRDKTAKAEEGTEITVKGFCSGKNLFDEVLLTQCVITK